MISLATLFTLIITISTSIVVALRFLHARNDEQRRQLLTKLDIHPVNEEEEDPLVIGFMHPYCNAGGGGERVLWAAIAYLQRTEPNAVCLVYTGDIDSKTRLPLKKENIVQRCRERFGIQLNAKKLHFIHLKWRWLIEDSTWKRFTLLGQGIGASLLAVEAMWRMIPDVYFDTLGLAFTYPVVRFLSSQRYTPDRKAKRLPIAAYIHYPTISASMLNRVSSRQTTYANDASVTGSGWKSTAKLLYYRIFSYLYTSCLLTSPPLLLSVNSSWTGAHVSSLLSTQVHSASSALSFISLPISIIRVVLGYDVPTPKAINQPPIPSGAKTTSKESPKEASGHNPRIIFPPCDVESMKDMALESRRNVIFSCAQFRPEKDHAKQIQSLAILFRTHPELFLIPEPDESSTLQGGDSRERASILESGPGTGKPPKDVMYSPEDGDGGLKLVLLGSARHEEDLHRVQELRDLAKRLGVEAHVEFRLNAPYSELLHWLSVASVGISTMVEEHFGIGVVEFMAAGLISVVHASGGPIMDIVVPFDGKPTGFHASTDEEFAEQLYRALTLPPEEMLRMRERARKGSRRFSTQNFEDGFGELWNAAKTALQ
ncbi:asparagine-linked glycosylation protein [Serendipita sp. 405]|nr:asparagine-linked glycosylation protein [Serendipita sp. 405]